MVNEIIHGDCLEVMPQIADGSIDLIVTDPPYMMNYRSNMRKERFDYIENDKNAHKIITEYIQQCHRIMKNNTAIYMFCSWHQVDFFKTEFEKFFNLKNIIVWSKGGGGTGDLEGSYIPTHELCLYGHKGRHLLTGKRISDVIKSNRVVSETMVHPTEKPVDICTVFIEKSSKENDIVFDGFIGSGTTAVAAASCGRRYIGVEKELKYVKVARQRLDNVQPVMNF